MLHILHNFLNPFTSGLLQALECIKFVLRDLNGNSQLFQHYARTFCSSAAQSKRHFTAHLSLHPVAIGLLQRCPGLPASTLAPLQRVLHAAARLVLDLRPRDRVIPCALRELHWLPISQRINYKLCLLVHKSSIGRAPAYIADMLTAAEDVLSLASVYTARRFERRLHCSSHQQSIWRPGFFSRCSSSLESAAG